MECCLAQGELIRLEGGKDGLVLRCLSGTVWLTKGDGMDYLVPAGKRIMLAKGESALVEALQPADLLLGDPSLSSHMVRPAIGLVAC